MPGDGGLPLLRFATAPPGLDVAVTTRAGGVSEPPYDTLNLGYHVGDDPAAVAENRRRVCAALGVEVFAVADQQHRAEVVRIDRSNLDAGYASEADAVARLGGTDALHTDEPGATLCTLVADCAPVVVFDPAHRAVGVAHCGRGGLQSGVVPHLLQELAAYGTRPGDVWVGVGPRIAGPDYEVGPAEVAAVMAALDAPGVVLPTSGGRAGIDLAAGIAHQLALAGVDPARVEVLPVTTRATTDVLFSDRAARPCGRFGLVARLAP